MLRASEAPTRPVGPGARRPWLDRQELGASRSRAKLAYAVSSILALVLAPIDLGLAALDHGVRLAPMLIVRATLLLTLLVGLARLARGATAVEADRWITALAPLIAFASALGAALSGGHSGAYLAMGQFAACAYAFVPRPLKEWASSAVAVVVATPLSFSVVNLAGGLSLSSFGPDLPVVAAEWGLQIAATVTLVFASHVTFELRREVLANRPVGRYRTLRLLGRGGMGEVWAAWDPVLGREVAVKLLTEGVLSPPNVARFLREIRAIRSLSHPNTVRIYDCGSTDEGLLYYTMERYEGESLGARLAQRGTLERGEALRIAREVCRSLAEAHAVGIVHRDIKPENVFIHRVGTEELVKVLDFGIAAFAFEGDDAITRTGQVLGTPRYMAPETFAGVRPASQADVYSVGVLLFQMACGRTPRELPSRGERPDEHLARLPAPLADLIRACLAEDPEHRPPDATVLLARLCDPALEA